MLFYGPIQWHIIYLLKNMASLLQLYQLMLSMFNCAVWVGSVPQWRGWQPTYGLKSGTCAKIEAIPLRNCRCTMILPCGMRRINIWTVQMRHFFGGLLGEWTTHVRYFGHVFAADHMICNLRLSHHIVSWCRYKMWIFWQRPLGCWHLWLRTLWLPTRRSMQHGPRCYYVKFCAKIWRA